uniref:YEATS domain-containing protein n=1 Tax=Scylla olivacea TaxID=85551 RepID=A0A0P4W7X7_SCYOL
MTSTAGHNSQGHCVQEDVKPGPSGCSTPTVTLQQEPDPYDEECPIKATGTKRILSTMDPDYAHPPDSKRLREMHQRAQDELSQRVIKVVEKELHKAIVEKETEMEEIDARILRVQQCLHTIRYCASLSYYNIGKDETQGNEAKDRKLSGLHPAIRRHLGEAQEPCWKTAECLTRKHTSQHKSPDPITDKKGKELYKESESNSQPVDHTKTPTTLTANTTITATDSSSESNALPLPFSHCSDEISDKSQTYAAKEANRSRPPSPKHLLPLPPDNTATISQGRQQQLQNKRRLIVGNTYQYLAPVPGEELVDSFRYKWQLYVRAPPSDPDTSTFLQSVTFILDHSYAPHHIITIKQPPFVLSRRGWGEFKVQLTLRFMDQRNKPICLLHPLVLSRQDDALALTGLWRLGQENWYDLWVYLPNPETNLGADGCASIMEEEFGPSTLTQELNTGVISSQVENNITVDHEPALGTGVTSHYLNEKDCAKSDNILNEESDGVGTLSNSAPCVKKLSPASSLIETADEVTKKESEESSRKKGIVNGKTCKVLVRQSDGSLKSYALPPHLYPQAMQIALDHSKQNNTNSNIISISKLIEETKSSQGTSHQGANYVDKRNKGQLKDTLKPITLKLPTHQNTSILSCNKVGVVGVGTTHAGAIHLAEAGNSKGKLTVLPAATDTATTTCPQHMLLQMKKEKKLALLQKQFGGKPPKQTSTSPSFRLFQVQTLSLQTPSHESPTTVKHVSEIPVIGIPQSANQNHIPLRNVRHTSNGQLLMPEKLKTMGLQLLTKKKAHDVTSTLSATTITTTTVTTTATSTSPGVSIQGGRVVVGTNSFQLLKSQGKMAVKQLPLLSMHNNKISNIPVQPLLFNNKGDLVVIKSSGGQVKDTSAIIKTEGNDETKHLKVKDSSSLLSDVSEICSMTDSGSQKNLIGANNRENQVDEEQASTYWEDYLSRVCEACKSSTSSEVCVSLWLKMLPLVHPSQTPPSPFSFCQAKSCQQFLRWPLAKQRACEVSDLVIITGRPHNTIIQYMRNQQ